MPRLFRLALLLLSLSLFTSMQAQQSHNPLPQYGVESISSDYFEQRYQSSDLVHYLDNLDRYVTYQAETTGQFNQADRLIFSIEGSSYRWNSYYLDGFRIDSRYFSGSTLYTPDMQLTNLSMDYIGSSLHFEQSRKSDPFISASFNVGGLGGISPGTEAAIHLFHPTATDRAYKDITLRNQMNGAGSFAATQVVERDGRRYYHSQSINFGEREIVDFDNTGISHSYPESYLNAQFSGDLAMSIGGLFDTTHYLANYSSRSNLNSEFYYGEQETAAYRGYSASLYGTAKRGKNRYSSGFTFAQHNTKHEDINYSRNLYDQDGEAFEPYAPDGNNFELSHAILFKREFNEWLSLTFDGFNSLLYADPSTTEFTNMVYTQAITEESATPLYIYKWRANSYASGLLENSLRLSAERELSPSVTLRSDVALTLDAMLLSDSKSKLSPNVELQAGLFFAPNRWFSGELTLSRRRVSYTIEDLQYLSSDYLNGDIYYYSGGSTDNLEHFTSTGGALHSFADGVKQPAYWALDIPINLTFGRHRISLQHSARKYVNSWTTRYDVDASNYGYYLTDEQSGVDIFFLNSGATPNYIIDHYEDGVMGDSLLTDSPFYFSSNIEYSYTSPNFFFSFAWQSYMQSGLSTLGNGPLHNNLGVLSESSANPNTSINTANPDSDFMAVGRLDQERAYVMRMFASYNFSEKLNLALNFKFKDGQPFSYFDAMSSSDSEGSRQVAIYPSTTRGINSFDGNFGTREDAFFNLDVRATYRTEILNKRCEMQLNLYNLYDFGTELTEYVFDQDLEQSRYAMSLNIPRDLIFSIKYFL